MQHRVQEDFFNLTLKRLKKEYRSHVETKVSESDTKTQTELTSLKADMASMKKEFSEIRSKLKQRIDDLERLVDFRVTLDFFDKRATQLTQ